MESHEFIEILEKNIKIADKDFITRAFNFAREAHKDQKRDSGEPYIIHPIDVATLVSEYKLDDASIAAALLHDTVEDTEISLEDIKKNFSQEVADLVDGLTKISSSNFKSKTEKNAENFRKLMISTSKDIRILIIKLLDRLSNIRTLNGIKNKERRDKIANETLMIHIPLAEKIGMYSLKLELEDLCFAEVLTEERNKIVSEIKETTKNKKNITDEILRSVTKKIKAENGVDCTIFGRIKKPYSIWKKMLRQAISFEKLFDIVAFRIIVKDVQDCYRILGILSTSYIIVPNTLKDYINKPKTNGYQSLHIVIIGPKNVRFEVQIRTEEMDNVAEYGVASHWMFKQNVKTEKNLNQYNYLKKIIENLESSEYSVDNFEDLKHEIYQDEIFCYTPMGDLINLSAGATGIDFAYAIHRDIGNRCSGVKINGSITQFKTPLKSGDEVEILTSKAPQVREEWLSVVKTAKAKQEIKAFIRNSKQKEFEKIGRDEIDVLLKELNLSVNDELIEKNIQDFNNVKKATEVYALIAQGKIKKKEFLKILFPEFEKNKTKDNQLDEKRFSKIKLHKAEDPDGIEGLDRNIAYKYGKCCYPVPPEDIVGVVNSGVGITIHKKICSMLKTITEDRIIDLEWNNNINTKYISKMNIAIDSKPGILAKIVNLCSEKKINIVGISTINESDVYQEIELKVEVQNSEELNLFKAYIRNLQGILDIR